MSEYSPETQQRARTIGVIWADDDTSITVEHVYLAEGSHPCEDCGGPSHDAGLVGLVMEEGEMRVMALLAPDTALLLANRLTRAAALVLESGEDRPDVEREAARFAAPAPKAPKTAAEEKVWAAWRDLADNDPAPVKRIARSLGMSNEDVAFIVYPAETFGRWSDDQEPDPGRAS